MKHIASLCQTCYAEVRPDEYFPYTLRDGTCCGCGDWTFVARARHAEAAVIASRTFASIWDWPECARKFTHLGE